MKLLTWELRCCGKQRPDECGWGLWRRLTWRSSSDRRMMLDRSSFSCLATFFHFNPAPLSVSSTSKDSWEIQAVPPSDTWEQMPVIDYLKAPFAPPPPTQQSQGCLPILSTDHLEYFQWWRKHLFSRSHGTANPHLGPQFSLFSLFLCGLLCILSWKEAI